MGFGYRFGYERGNGRLKRAEVFGYGASLGLVIREDKGRLIMAMGQQFKHWDATPTGQLVVFAISNVVEDWMYDVDGVIIKGGNVIQ
ncbi:hypothetical protein IEQ34_013789 [Dendrobium chrysotoxum]|uniref:Uncharacterized protein n=1 Tax=Dendrobium chrysotoxum TaxID=161865 RepID=A0AAV7G9K6_DENCH|nr:hypothetical protein IEQ34_013789 [Dendrobium chrysotoxum]